MDSFRERFAAALARQGLNMAQLATQIGVTRQTLYNINDGTTKAETVRAVTLYPLAEALGVHPDWLLYGKGSRDLNGGTETNSQPDSARFSHPVGINHDTMHQAKLWIAAEERLVGPYSHGELVDQVIAVYELMQAGGGDLNTEQRAQRFDAAWGRQQDLGESSGKIGQ